MGNNLPWTYCILYSDAECSYILKNFRFLKLYKRQNNNEGKLYKTRT